MIPFKSLRKLAGKTSWMANIVSGSRWTAQRIYAALCAEEDRGPQAARRQGGSHHALVYRRTVETALRWILEFWSPDVRLARTFGAPLRQAEIEFAFDASLWGLGGILVHRKSHVVLQFFAATLDELDESRFGFRIGECTAQAVLEALAILCGLKLWAWLLKDAQGICRVASDSIAALSAMRKMASPQADAQRFGSGTLAFARAPLCQ